MLVRFRYRGTWAWWWQIDDVVVRDACLPVPGGLVVGTVSNAGSGAPLDGATVTSDDVPADAATSGPTPDDPLVAHGFYTLLSSVTGTRHFTTAAAEHDSSTEPVDVVADGVVLHDIQLDRQPTLSIADAISASLTAARHR